MLTMLCKVSCHCGKKAPCELCHGSGQYDYEFGPAGWQPFRCPNCEGKGTVFVRGLENQRCRTCQGEGKVDPANPPAEGMWDKLSKIFFGA